jgi:ABC-type sugar transport system ATPase subunit
VMRLSSSNERAGEFKTLAGGHTLRMPIEKGELAPLNKPSTLAIRPEHVVLKQAADGLANTLSAEVREVNFAGATSTVKLDAGGLSLEALVLQPNNFSVGSQCAATLPAEHISLLKE